MIGVWSNGLMPGLPSTSDSLLVRTDFTDEDAWNSARTAALAENEEGFRAYVRLVDDRQFDGVGWRELQEQIALLSEQAAVMFIVDGPALGEGHPIQVVDLGSQARPPFRCVAGELWGVDNNLNIANMDWEEFADAVDPDGVHRGFT